jgi:hypothetical protein
MLIVIASSNATEGSASLGPGFSSVYLDGRLSYPEESKVVVFVTAVAWEGYDRETLDVSSKVSRILPEIKLF